MSLQYNFEEEPDEEGALVLPYPPDYDEGRTNCGFIDLRGQPELVAKIPEASSSPAFQNLLMSLAEPSAPFISIGCELGSNPTPDGMTHYGGYLQITFSDLHGLAQYKGQQTRLSQHLSLCLRVKADGHFWKVDFVLSVVAPERLGGPDQVWSPIICFWASDPNVEAALQSREDLIAALKDCLFSYS